MVLWRCKQNKQKSNTKQTEVVQAAEEKKREALSNLNILLRNNSKMLGVIIWNHSMF